MSDPVIHDGQKVCAKHCDVCDGADHHWLMTCLDPDDEDDIEHAAFKAGITELMQCKHCPAWRDLIDEDFDGESFAEETAAGGPFMDKWNQKRDDIFNRVMAEENDDIERLGEGASD